MYQSANNVTVLITNKAEYYCNSVYIGTDNHSLIFAYKFHESIIITR